jgi:hypothetical protein
MKRTASGLLLILAAGGATEQKTVYEKGATEAQMKKDHAACLRASVTGEDSVVSSILKLDRDAYRRCMEGRGYTLRAAQS